MPGRVASLQKGAVTWGAENLKGMALTMSTGKTVTMVKSLACPGVPV